MKFTSILRQVIMEQSRFEILRDALTKPTTDKRGEKQKPKMSIGEFLQLVQADPTTRLNNVDPETADTKELEKIKAGKYVNWIIKNYLTPITERQPGDSGYDREVKQVKETFMEDLYKVTEDLQKFDRFKSRIKGEKDINKLTPSQLYDAVKDFDLTLATTTKAERKSAPVHPGAELMFDGENWRVIKIENKGATGKEAACFYGGNNKETRWCTSAPGASWFDSVDLIKMLSGPMVELKSFFKPEFAKGLTVGGEKLVIDSFSHGAIGKFIGLYGLDDLIDNLPDSLKEFQIQNRDSNNKITITIPESISRFKNLQMILLDNCIQSIPDSICELPKLKFLALINNPELTSIPECIGGLPNLFFLNLKGSENVSVPESIKSKGTDMGNGMWDLQD